jgi:hypothetical protein
LWTREEVKASSPGEQDLSATQNWTWHWPPAQQRFHQCGRAGPSALGGRGIGNRELEEMVPDVGGEAGSCADRRGAESQVRQWAEEPGGGCCLEGPRLNSNCSSGGGELAGVLAETVQLSCLVQV